MLTTSGALQFSRYAFPPNELGHCGPPGAQDLLTGHSEAELRSRAELFDGAWPYLELLARCLGSADPLAADAVCAYWTGGPLLGQVPRAAFEQTVQTAFSAQPGVLDRLDETPELLSAGPSHAFHVFVVYPWIGLLHSGGEIARRVLDDCRVRWGTVEWVDGEQAGVSSRALTWDGDLLGLGPERLEVRRWAQAGHAFVRDPQPGEQVSLHWDWICDRLTTGECDELADRTARQLDPVNQWLAGREP